MESRTRQSIEEKREVDERINYLEECKKRAEKLFKDLEEEKKDRELPDDHAPNSRKRPKTTVVLESRNVCDEEKKERFIFLLALSISSVMNMMTMSIVITYYFRLAK